MKMMLGINVLIILDDASFFIEYSRIANIHVSELISVEQPEDYQKESWQMDEQEKLDIVPKLREKGNEDFRQKKFKEASAHYAKAIGILEQLMLK